jgi:hypothetical protein
MGYLRQFLVGFTCVFRPDPTSSGIAVARWLVFIVKCLIAGVLFGLATLWITGCVSELDQRQHWQDCGAVMHEVCREKGNNSDRRDCEYEFYKECVNE